MTRFPSRRGVVAAAAVALLGASCFRAADISVHCGTSPTRMLILPGSSGESHEDNASTPFRQGRAAALSDCSGGAGLGDSRSPVSSFPVSAPAYLYPSDGAAAQHGAYYAAAKSPSSESTHVAADSLWDSAFGERPAARYVETGGDLPMQPLIPKTWDAQAAPLGAAACEDVDALHGPCTSPSRGAAAFGDPCASSPSRPRGAADGAAGIIMPGRGDPPPELLRPRYRRDESVESGRDSASGSSGRDSSGSRSSAGGRGSSAAEHRSSSSGGRTSCSDMLVATPSSAPGFEAVGRGLGGPLAWPGGRP